MSESATIIEKAAKAMIAAFNDDTLHGNPAVSGGLAEALANDLTQVRIDGNFDLTKVCRAAIEAMREPTEAMISSVAAYRDEPAWGTCAYVWRGMIAAALSEDEGKG